MCCQRVSNVFVFPKSFTSTFHKADAGNAIDDRHIVSVTRFQVIKHFRIALSGRFTFKISLIAYFDRCTRIVVGYFPVFNVHGQR